MPSGLNPFLKIGVTRADLRLEGTTPVVSEMLNIRVKKEAKCLAKLFINHVDKDQDGRS